MKFKWQLKKIYFCFQVSSGAGGPAAVLSNSQLVRSGDTPSELLGGGLWLTQAFQDTANNNTTNSSNNNNNKTDFSQLEQLAALDPDEMEISAIYTGWTRWSRCSRNCKQKRERHCAVPTICGTAVVKMERGCHSDRCRGRDFHIVRKKKWRRKTKNQLKRNRAFYTKWTQWTPCTELCKTSRVKSCRFPLVCGNNEVTEEAYCYTEGSQCEAWYKAGKSLDIADEEGFPLKAALANVVDDMVGGMAVTTTPRPPSTFRDYASRCGVRHQPPPPPPPLDSPPKTADIAWALRIIGGREADPGRWPWQVVILNKYREAFCGGTLIHPRWVLTASHCVRKHLIVRVGEHDLVIHEGSETEYVVRRTIVHPDYNRDTVDNDVALLELPEPVELGRHAGLACLPDQQEALPDQEHCTIIGWGKEKKSHFFGTEVLHEARVGRQ